MPDYSLKRNTQAQNTQMHTHPKQTPDPMTQLSQASDNAKKDTEIALLREALATSAQNSEALIGQLVKSQGEFMKDIQSQVNEISHQFNKLQQTMKNCMELLEEQTENHLLTLQSQLESYNTNNQNQLQNLKSQNELFSKSLNAALTSVTDKLITQIKTDTVTALSEQRAIAYDSMQDYITATNIVVRQMNETAEMVNGYDEKIKTSLDKRVRAYNSSIKELFALNRKEKLFFFFGILGGIATPTILFLRMIADALSGIFE
jgi:IS1 family transposase